MPLPPRIQQLRDSGVLRVAGMLAAAFLTTMCGSNVGGGDTGGPAGGDTGGPGYGQHCTVPDTEPSLRVTLPDCTHIACTPIDEAGVETKIVEGVVHNTPDGAVVIDSCLPGADCAPIETVLSKETIDGVPPVPLSIPDGTFVQLAKQLKKTEGLWPTQKGRLIIQNLPTWGGAPNPTSSGSFFWFASYTSYNEEGHAWPDDPFLVEREIACESGGSNSPFYAWRFSSPDSPGSEVVAYMGEMVTWSIPDGVLAGEYEVFNSKAQASFGHNEFNYWLARK